MVKKYSTQGSKEFQVLYLSLFNGLILVIVGQPILLDATLKAFLARSRLADVT
jgi:hypothetical protein